MNGTSAKYSGWPKTPSQIATAPRGCALRNNGYGCFGDFAGTKRPKKINQAGLRGETMTQRVGISPHGRAWRASQKAMTALPPTADICSALGCVCFGP